MSVSEILLSYLANSSSKVSFSHQGYDDFQFPDISDEADDLLEFSDLLEMASGEAIPLPDDDEDSYLSSNCSSPAYSTNSSDCSSPPYSTSAESQEESSDESDEEFMDFWNVCEGNQLSSNLNNISDDTLSYLLEDLTSTASTAVQPVSAIASSKPKRKRIRKSRAKVGISIAKKQRKLTPEEKVVNLVNFLKNMKNGSLQRPKPAVIVAKEEISSPEFDIVTHAQWFLDGLLTGNALAIQSLANVLSPSGVLTSQSIASLHAKAGEKRRAAQLNAWRSNSIASMAFPDKHVGIGQISGAARGFTSALSDLIPASVFYKLKFITQMNESAVMKSMNNQIAAPFVWRSTGMLDMGYASELEFHGLIRGSSSEAGIVNMNVSFDAFALVLN